MNNNWSTPTPTKAPDLSLLTEEELKALQLFFHARAKVKQVTRSRPRARTALIAVFIAMLMMLFISPTSRWNEWVIPVSAAAGLYCGWVIFYTMWFYRAALTELTQKKEHLNRLGMEINNIHPEDVYNAVAAKSGIRAR